MSALEQLSRFISTASREQGDDGVYRQLGPESVAGLFRAAVIEVMDEERQRLNAEYNETVLRDLRLQAGLIPMEEWTAQEVIEQRSEGKVSIGTALKLLDLEP